MKTFKRLKQYKARQPEQTIEIVREILANLGITMAEEKRRRSDAGVASSRIAISNGSLLMGDFGTNGKGMTDEYSMASAYGEMMERLCNGILFGDYPENAYFSNLTKYMCAPDEVWMDAGEAYQAGKEVLSKLYRVSDEEMEHIFPTEKMPCVPFYDVFENKQIMLPHKSLRMVIGSNGMAAGNTYREAVVQGLCEIYERAAVMEAYRDNPKILQLHLEAFQGNAIYDRLNGLIKEGYQVKILDLSMGKKYPVVGLLLEKNGLKAFRAGADPCPVTALERCLTEIFQGDSASVSGFFKNRCCPSFPEAVDEGVRFMINDQEIAYHVDGSGMAAECIFNVGDEFNEDFAGTDAESEESDYEYMISLTESLGYKLYIRDWSYLGFPAYHIVVPEMSNYDLMYLDGAFMYEVSFDRIPFRPDRMMDDIAAILGRMFERFEQNMPPQDARMCR